MSWPKGGRSGPRGYHHGNLKEALIRAALELTVLINSKSRLPARVGKAYLQFAKHEPAYYSAMFEAGIPPETRRSAAGRSNIVAVETDCAD